MKHTRPAVTIVETLVVIIVFLLLLGGAMFALSFATISSARSQAQTIKDGTQLRGIVMAFTSHAASQRNDRFPTPSQLDLADHTIVSPAEQKDTTANVFAISIWENSLTPEIVVSPTETGNIEVDEDYSYDSPSGAANPQDAIWDPAFRADFTDLKTPGNVSYAHQRPLPDPNRLWQNTFSPDEIVVTTRTPQASAVNPTTSIHTLTNQSSNTFSQHGQPNSWSGNLAFADNHVEFATSLADTVRHAPDTPYIDDPAEGDRFLSIFIKSGLTDTDYKPIWD
ncbi:MAG: hypothetical protein AAGB34_06515 [Planctomycetota bacterium]